MDWSYDLLNEKEQRLFRSLAVFSGSWDLDASESICSANGRLKKSEILDLLSKLVRDHFPMTPAGIIKHLKLKRPIFRETARNGHFGRPGFSWEETDMAAALKKAAGR